MKDLHPLCPVSLELSSFASTSKPFVSLCRNDAKLWFALCDRRWGSKTQIRKWGNGKITYKQLYKALNEFENLIGFWRRSGHGKIAGLNSPPPPLVFFEWGSSFITGSRVSPSKSGTYRVVKAPFLWISIMPNSAPVSFLDPECRFELFDDLVKSGELGLLENELVPVNVSFMGKNHVVVEENLSFAYSNSNSLEGRQIGFSSVSRSLLMSEIYQYFANRTSPSGDRTSRKQRKREGEAREEKIGARAFCEDC
ncbi:F-box protein [Camellia lanceoleosa]|uniref:F-box protein n=1 Tax=Camellia lanceoleosa TaxID=1840588 RepID=A0ACC0GNT0_9ERIC|nr:F-box protein [Camellia lanceoleosa]